MIVRIVFYDSHVFMADGGCTVECWHWPLVTCSSTNSCCAVVWWLLCWSPGGQQQQHHLHHVSTIISSVVLSDRQTEQLVARASARRQRWFIPASHSCYCFNPLMRHIKTAQQRIIIQLYSEPRISLSLYQINSLSPHINGQCTNFIVFDVTL